MSGWVFGVAVAVCTALFVMWQTRVTSLAFTNMLAAHAEEVDVRQELVELERRRGRLECQVLEARLREVAAHADRFHILEVDKPGTVALQLVQDRTAAEQQAMWVQLGLVAADRPVAADGSAGPER